MMIGEEMVRRLEDVAEGVKKLRERLDGFETLVRARFQLLETRLETLGERLDRADEVIAEIAEQVLPTHESERDAH